MSELENVAGNDKELQEFLMIEKQKQQIKAQIHQFCWEKCIGKPSSKLDYA